VPACNNSGSSCDEWIGFGVNGKEENVCLLIVIGVIVNWVLCAGGLA